MVLMTQMRNQSLTEERRRWRFSREVESYRVPLPDRMMREHRSAPTMNSKTVYLIEHREYTRTSLTCFLEGEGIEVSAFCNAEEALDLVCQDPPGLLIIGCLPPGAGGIQIVRRVRKNHSFPVILISSSYGENECVDALESGADDYMASPISHRELAARVNDREGMRVRADVPAGVLQHQVRELPA